MRTILILCLSSTLFACGGGQPGPKADEGKTPAQIQEQATAADGAGLEAIVGNYKGAIESLKTEASDLDKQLEKLTKDAATSLLGDAGKSDELKAKMTELKAQADTLVAQLKELKDRLEIYTKELASRAKAG